LKEIFDLKQALHKTRQELSMALHKGQSAVNTVCRLQAENEKLTLQIASNDDLVERLESKIDQMTVSQKGKETEMKGLR
jgi:predicted RNase H-like nuclease (RuvC/YqgF family)